VPLCAPIGRSATVPINDPKELHPPAKYKPRRVAGTCIGVTIPVYAWSRPWTILGGRLQFLAATPARTLHPDRERYRCVAAFGCQKKRSKQLSGT
jgi:hypothetical protein